MDFTVHLKSMNSADLDIRLNQREPRNFNYDSNSLFPFFYNENPQ